MLQRLNVVPLQPAGLAEPEPRLDSALISLCAVVIENAQDPLPALITVDHVRKNGSIFYRDRNLIVEAVVNPSLYLFAGAEAVVHRNVERMMDVVAAFLRTQLALEFLFGPRARHSVMSMP